MNDITQTLCLHVNDERVERQVPVRMHLVDFLREEIGRAHV